MISIVKLLLFSALLFVSACNAKKSADGDKSTISFESEARSSGFPQMTKSGGKLIFAWTDDEDKVVKVASLQL